MNLARTLLDLGAHDTALGFALGIVVDTAPFTIQINGDTVDIVGPSRCANYTPVLNDRVLVLRPGGTGVLVVDQIV